MCVYCEILGDIGVRIMKVGGETIFVLRACCGFHCVDRVSTLSLEGGGGQPPDSIPPPITNPLQSRNFLRAT